jgi:hypothetical protein
MLPSALKMEAVFSSETLVSTYKSTRRYYLEEQSDIRVCVCVCVCVGVCVCSDLLNEIQSITMKQKIGTECDRPCKWYRMNNASHLYMIYQIVTDETMVTESWRYDCCIWTGLYTTTKLS